MNPASPPLDELLDRYRGPSAQQHYDEAVNQLEHGLQCAELARREAAPDALVAAALLHDVGHLLTADRWDGEESPTEDLRHEEAGGRYLRRWFGPEVTAPVVLHVAAKRYLCATDPRYLERLSPASVQSLELQGGPMDEEERARFEARVGWEDALRLRRWDDDAKVVGAEVAPFEDHEPLLRALAAR